MAQPTGTFDTYDSIGTREDLSDMIHRLEPTETPFMTAIGKEKVTNTYSEWQTDALAAVDTANARVEGDNFTGVTSSPTTRLGNWTQISGKEVVVSGTQEVTNKAGRGSEMDLQVAKRLLELKRDMEGILTSNQARVVGDSSTARKLRGLESWYATNVSRGSGGANGSTSAAATDGTQREFTETLMTDVQQSCWNAGGMPTLAITGGFNRTKFSNFSGGATRFVDPANAKLSATIDIYVGDFGQLKCVPSRFSRSRTFHLIEPKYWAVGYLRPVFTEPLAKAGDNHRKQIITEYTLIAKNEASSGVVADLTTA